MTYPFSEPFIITNLSQIKHVSMKLANLYMKRVTMELHTMRCSDRESAQEALLLQGVHFAYKVHQVILTTLQCLKNI